MKVLKNVLYFLMCFIVMLGCACDNGGHSGDSSSGDKNEYREILNDPTFKKGFNVSNLKSGSVGGTWWKYSSTADTSEQPAWDLAQYCDLSATRFRLDGEGNELWRYNSEVNDLSLATMFEEGKGIEGKEGNYFTLTNVSGSKKVLCNPNDGSIVLNVDTSKEYLGENGKILPRSNGEDWVHIVLGQSVGNINVSECSEIRVQMEFSLDKDELISSVGGASQFQWIFSVKDLNSAIGDYFWFNITLYDNRYAETGFPGTSLFDGGKADSTGKYIYAPTGEQVFGEKMQYQKKYTIDLDIRPLLEQAFNSAKEKGALKESSFESMVLNSMNLGWEVTNVSAVQVSMANLGLKVK